MDTVKYLRIVLALIGVAIILLGLNIGLGGIKTLGWQTARDFISVTDVAVFSVQDNHIRFIGGIWFGVGVLFLSGAFVFDKLRQTLIVVCLIIPAAGLFRLSALDLDIILSASIGPSFAFELIGFPFLALWMRRAAVG